MALWHPTRRQAIAGLGATSALLLAGTNALGQGSGSENGVLATRGVVYDTGTDFGYEGHLSRMSWWEADVRGEIAAIRDQLHCNTIQIVGSDLGRLELAANLARETGLGIWLQPRLFEVSADEQIEHLKGGAELAARLAHDGADVVFSVGCETTLFQHGIVPGGTFAERLQPLFSASQDEGQRIMGALNAYLGRARSVAREHFAGPLTYSAGSWEYVVWSEFDVVGVNLYRDASNRAHYRDLLRGYKEHGLPVVVTEFGLSTFEGAADAGAGGFMIVDYSTYPPTIPEQYVRSEQEQAREIAELLQLYAEEGIAGAFVYNFITPNEPHSPDPRSDIDMASHAIVKTLPGSPDGPVEWEPKLAFHEIARIYSEL